MRIRVASSALAVVLFCALNAGCDQLNHEEPDFGASVVARYIQAARVKCDAAEAPELWECAELGREKKEAWLAARSALDSYEVFKSGCYPAAGMTKCEAMIEKALIKPTRQ
ncbi:hypothetical protein CY658_04860 [Variovorax sp. RO1]|uniref:hypothetical protein n=1 Tax=Variovorax sp. RO1 TaxID=2066034 RepID=UPI000C717239|nr:hypothetical protein [Variovorax sp. RO1]PLC06367.1 hypothetical protein CY658_04860 [Variovorax sp. RO1]